MNWIINKLFGKSGYKSLTRGTIVEYQGQKGVVMGGSIMVKFDTVPKWFPKDVQKHHPNNRTATFNINKDNLKVESL